eukprot:491243-Pelagomonas_calceolata.AAC.4
MVHAIPNVIILLQLPSHLPLPSLAQNVLNVLAVLVMQFTPFPNVTVYYCIYRAISHYRALNGAKALKSAFTNPESARVQHLLNEAVPENKGPKGDKDCGRLGGTSAHGASLNVVVVAVIDAHCAVLCTFVYTSAQAQRAKAGARAARRRRHPPQQALMSSEFQGVLRGVKCIKGQG